MSPQTGHGKLLAKFLHNIHQFIQYRVLAPPISALDCIGHTMLQIIPQHHDAHPMQGRLGGRDLMQHLGARLVFLEHPFDTPNLAFNSLQAIRKALFQILAEKCQS